MMNRCGGKKSGFAACEEMRGVAEHHEPVACPKPRRLTQLAAGVDPLRPLRWQPCSQAELPCESKGDTELLVIFLTKGGEASQVASSSPPPFFCGSPPCRASNPVVHDARFGEERAIGPFLLPNAIPSGSPMGGSPATSSSRKGCGPTKLGLKPAAMRIEGFHCLDRDRDRDRRGCGITAIA